MEFDKSRVYTTVNADELKLGSRIIPADNLNELKYRVEDESMTFSLTEIRDECSSFRFVTDNGNSWELAYLVSEPANLKWTDLKVGDVIRKDNVESMVVAVDRCGTCFHILACKGCSPQLDWIGDNELNEWEKVENEK